MKSKKTSALKNSDSNLEKAYLASSSSRLGASIIDTLIVMTLLLPLIKLKFLEDARVGETTVLEAILYTLLSCSITYFVINAYLLSKNGQSLGKKLFRIKILSNESDQVIPLWKFFLARYFPIVFLMYILPLVVSATLALVVSFLILVDTLFIFRGDRRCIHDLVAGTRVVNDGPKEASEPGGD